MAVFVNIGNWLRDNSDKFVPPVCNLMLHQQQLKIFLVGGPNIRQDYHLNEGEEFFFMIKGDMCLKVIEGGKHRDVVIREGHSFLLPARVPHSPQRYADTVGLVVERERLLSEMDGLRFYTGTSSTEVLFERWFHCDDLGTQLTPIIMEFFDSIEHKTDQPGPDSRLRRAPYEDNAKARLMQPLDAGVWLRDRLLDHSLSTGFHSLFGGDHDSFVGFYGTGRHEIKGQESETMLWQFGTGQWRSCTPASLQQLSPVATQSHEPIDDTILHLQADDLIVLPVNTRWRLDNDLDSGVTMSVCMPPPSSSASSAP